MEGMLNLIANVGFPIAVAAYLLIRIENKLGDLTRAIAELRECIITLPSREYGSGSRNTHVSGNSLSEKSAAYPPS